MSNCFVVLLALRPSRGKIGPDLGRVQASLREFLAIAGAVAACERQLLLLLVPFRQRSQLDSEAPKKSLALNW